jgi:hypothetical protein
MHISALNKNHHVLKRLPIREFHDTGDAFIDLDDNYVLDTKEPVLGLKEDVISNFLRFNEEVMTKECPGGDITIWTWKGETEDESVHEFQDTQEVLTDILAQHSPFPEAAQPEQLSWAIGKFSGDYNSSLFILAPKNGVCAAPQDS